MYIVSRTTIRKFNCHNFLLFGVKCGVPAALLALRKRHRFLKALQFRVTFKFYRHCRRFLNVLRKGKAALLFFSNA